ncbi:DUF397 domain-containing protein [Streptomyces aurantiacus]|uniref:DUF397 domain-containing protein n=1 Tax=Streptomyces aurantiacus JA 4570 TaxID=1286094 RepID=S3ZDJ5_9ACTN|nr:DUF397 domain-containing protein [Streptomyces aurantiacus]EPH41756.1 hypothetical protein STRAU_5180 [Streptomyces aurantiacus JA 4570]
MADSPHPEPLTWARAAPDDEEGPGPWIELAFGPDDTVHLRTTDAPDHVVTTTRTKWEAFVLGARAGEFDHFVEALDGGPPSDSKQSVTSD